MSVSEVRSCTVAALERDIGDTAPSKNSTEVMRTSTPPRLFVSSRVQACGTSVTHLVHVGLRCGFLSSSPLWDRGLCPANPRMKADLGPVSGELTCQ